MMATWKTFVWISRSRTMVIDLQANVLAKHNFLHTNIIYNQTWSPLKLLIWCLTEETFRLQTRIASDTFTLSPIIV